MKILKQFIVALLIAFACSSCGLSKISQQVSVKGITEFDLKGLTGLQANAYIVNASQHNITMDRAEVTLYHNDKRAVKLTQVGEALVPAESRGEVKTLWKISNVDPRSITSFVGLLSSRKFDDMTIDYSARFSVKKINKTISQENVNLQNFIAIFAKEQNEK